MEKIDGNWIKERLSGRRGEQEELARFVGFTPDKLTKILSGVRRVQADEVPMFIAFFEENGLRGAQAQGFKESRQTFHQRKVGNVSQSFSTGEDVGFSQQVANLESTAIHLSHFDVTTPIAGFALMPGDRLFVDLQGQPAAGDLVIATVADPQTGEAFSCVRRFLPPYLAAGEPDADGQIMLIDGVRVAIMAKVIGVVRTASGFKPSTI